MDTGRAELVPLAEEVAKEIEEIKALSVFRTGEVVNIKKSRFKIVCIDRKTMLLTILPKFERP